MFSVIINFLINLAIFVFDGIFIAISAANSWWLAMAITILFVSYSFHELTYSYTDLLRAILARMHGESNDKNKE